MASLRDAGDLTSAIHQVVTDEAARLREAAISTAVAAFEADLREAIGVKAVRLVDYYQIERHAQHLVITVKHGAGQ